MNEGQKLFLKLGELLLEVKVGPSTLLIRDVYSCMLHLEMGLVLIIMTAWPVTHRLSKYFRIQLTRVERFC